jgi:hypothetical protein
MRFSANAGDATTVNNATATPSSALVQINRDRLNGKFPSIQLDQPVAVIVTQ